MNNKILISILFLLCLTIAKSENYDIETIKREDFIGKKIKFLNDKDNVHGYAKFGENKNAYPYLSYDMYKGKIATFVEKNGDIYKLKTEEDEKTIYLKLYDFEDIPNNIGFLEILEKAKEFYIGKTFYNIKYNTESKVISVEFDEENRSYQQLFSPYVVKFLTGNDTIIENLQFNETYGGKRFNKDKIFKNIYTNKNPLSNELEILKKIQSEYKSKKLFDRVFLEEFELLSIEFDLENKSQFRKYSDCIVKFISKNNEPSEKKISMYESNIDKNGFENEIRTFLNMNYTTINPYDELTSNNITDKFKIKIDEFEGIKYYIHNSFSKELNENKYQLNLNYTRLLLQIKSTANKTELQFLSCYVNKDWLFHEKIKIKIDEQIKETTKHKSNNEVLDGGDVSELIAYNHKNDMNILKWISDNYKKEISVRYEGKGYYDTKISDKDKLAIKETLELYNMIQKKTKK